MYRYIQAEKANDPEARVAVMCRVLGVSARATTSGADAGAVRYVVVARTTWP